MAKPRCNTLYMCLHVILLSTRLAETLASGILYPYGSSELDITAPVNDDGDTGEIALSTPFPFFNQRLSSLYVNTNGVISFLMSVAQFTPDSFPLGSNARLIAPFWADIDTSRNTGRVYYRQTTTQAILNRTTGDVRRAFVFLPNFQATWAFVCTYAGVTFYGGSSTTPTNTLQVVLVTDGRHSFAIFNYERVTWTTGVASGGDSLFGLGGTPAQVGFNAGDGVRYFSVPGSRESSIVNIESTSNVNIPGRWMFRVDAATVASAGCSQSGTLYASPMRGPALGGTAITISGPCFTTSSRIVCDIGGAVVPGYYISDFSALCYTPPLFVNTDSVHFKVSIDGGATYTHSTFFIPDIGTAQDVGVIRVAEHDWITRGHYVIQWSSAALNSSIMDVDVLGFSFNNGSFSNRWLRLATGLPNSGALDLRTSLNALQDVGDAMGFGAIRLTPTISASGQNLTKPCLWSDIHYLQWFLNAYIAKEVIQPEQSTSGTFSNIFTKLKDAALKRESLVKETLELTTEEVISQTEWLNDELCTLWFEEDSTLTLPSDLPACPVVVNQAIRDRGRFEEDPECNRDRSGASGGCSNRRPGAAHCVRSNRCSPSGGGQVCCYGNDGNILILGDEQYGAGTQIRAHPKGCTGVENVVELLSNYWHDELPFEFCCNRSSNKETMCRDKYAERRPSDDGKNYRPPRPVTSGGDPHLVTLDGLNYTFNGVGEYVLCKTTSGHFTMQGRAQQISNINASVTAWTALAMKGTNETVEVRADAVRTVDVYIGGQFLDLDALGESYAHPGGITVARDPVTFAVNVSLDNDSVFMTVSHAAGTLNFILMLPDSLKTTTSGLLGVWNDDVTDDFTTPTGTQIPVDSPLRTIHYDFGEFWRTSWSDSIFTYDLGQTHSTFQNTAFLPVFNVSLASANNTEITLICGDNNQCLFDYVTTGSAAIAQATRDMINNYNEAIADTKIVITCGRLVEPENGVKNATESNYLLGTSIEFSCDDGFILTGSANRTCPVTSQWSGEEAVCVVDPGPGFPVMFAVGVGGVGMAVIVLITWIACLGKGEKNKVKPEPEVTNDDVQEPETKEDDADSDVMNLPAEARGSRHLQTSKSSWD